MARRHSNSRRLRTAYMATIVGIVMVLFILGVLTWFGLGLNHLKNAKIESYEIDLFFNERVNDLELAMVETAIREKPYVNEAHYRTAQQAWETYLKEVDPKADLSIIDGENPLKSHIVMTLKKDYFHLDSIQKIEGELLTAYEDRLQEVSYREEVFDHFSANLQRLVYFILLLASMLLFIAIGMINNTIRIALFSKRFIIKTMQLVGATSRFIRRPFLISAIGQGLISGLIAGCMVFLLIALLERSNPLFLEMTDIVLFLAAMLAIVVFGIVITVVSTYLALRKYLRLNLARLY